MSCCITISLLGCCPGESKPCFRCLNIHWRRDWRAGNLPNCLSPEPFRSMNIQVFRIKGNKVRRRSWKWVTQRFNGLLGSALGGGTCSGPAGQEKSLGPHLRCSEWVGWVRTGRIVCIVFLPQWLWEYFEFPFHVVLSKHLKYATDTGKSLYLVWSQIGYFFGFEHNFFFPLKLKIQLFL